MTISQMTIYDHSARVSFAVSSLYNYMHADIRPVGKHVCFQCVNPITCEQEASVIASETVVDYIQR